MNMKSETVRVRLARRVMRFTITRSIKRVLLNRAVAKQNIRQTLFFSLIYNGLGVPVAAGVPHPFIGITGRARTGPARFPRANTIQEHDYEDPCHDRNSNVGLDPGGSRKWTGFGQTRRPLWRTRAQRHDG